MKLTIERGEGVEAGRTAELIHEIGYQVKKQLLVSIHAELMDYCVLPRTQRKSQRVFDSRITDEIV
jgi:phenylacetate-CoA ligase